MKNELLRNNIIWKRYVISDNKDEYGKYSYSYENKTIRCYIKSDNGTRELNNNENFISKKINIIIRKKSINYKDRFQYNGDLYTVDNISLSQDRLFQTISLKKKNN